jgi:anti-sigma-K factor RskA
VAAYPAFPAAAPFPEHIGPSAVPTLRGHGFDRPRPPPAARDTSSERWRTAALILGAIAMAVLAFAVTRSCMHEEPARPVAAPR